MASIAHAIYAAFRHSLMVTSFVFVMMLVVEYLNVMTRGRWEEKLRGQKWFQYLFASLLGAAPGCLGPFAVVSLYGHRIVSFGAVVATMIATTGDAAFIMLTEFPGDALALFGLLFVLGVVVGGATDLLFGRTKGVTPEFPGGCVIHEEECCRHFSWEQAREQWRRCIPERGILCSFLSIFLLGVAVGEIGPDEWGWERITLLASAGVGLFIVATVPDHFIQEHLWGHVVKKHAVRVFLWTLGALLVIHLLTEVLDLDAWVRGTDTGKLVILLAACAIGIIPDSAPHYVFVLLYAGGQIPFSVLLASSVVQDGHGMLPLLAQSRRHFMSVKLINVVVGLGMGLIGYATGW